MLDSRSAADDLADEEINLVTFDPELPTALDAQFDEDLERSEEIVAGRWGRRPLPQRAFERAAKPAGNSITT